MSYRRNYAIKPGSRFNWWTAIKPCGRNRHGQDLWIFRCRCGHEKPLPVFQPFSGASKSCGCYRTAAATKHGLSKTSAYVSYQWMIARCYNPKVRGYSYYGGRGIRVCKRWLIGGVSQFYADMGDCPPGCTLDRKNNNGHYTPRNCRWATRVEQDNNKRTCRYIVFRGRKQTVTAWCRELGLHPRVIFSRLEHGWSVGKSLTTPPMHPYYGSTLKPK